MTPSSPPAFGPIPKVELRLPADTVHYPRKGDRTFWASPSTGNLYDHATLTAPARVTEVIRAHRLAGLLRPTVPVVTPLDPSLTDGGEHVYALYPDLPPVHVTGWHGTGADLIGTTLGRLATVRTDIAPTLNLPRLIRGRLVDARDSGDEATQHAARWLSRHLFDWDDRHPWSALADDLTLTHLNPDLSEFTLRNGEATIINTSAVYAAPRGYGLATARFYRDRFDDRFPADDIISGHPDAPDEGRLAALQRWKELSSMSRLLTTGDLGELMIRLSGAPRWTPTTGTTLTLREQHHLDAHPAARETRYIAGDFTDDDLIDRARRRYDLDCPDDDAA